MSHELSFHGQLQKEVILAAKEYTQFMRNPIGKDLRWLTNIQRRLMAAVIALEKWENGEEAPRV